jgi:cytochrome c-type biogenesis protein CcmE
MPRRWRFILGGAVVAGALLYLVGTGLGDNLVYFQTPTELLAKGAAAVGRPFRLSGEVEPGSIRWNAETLSLRFLMRDETSSMDVESTGAPPEMFHDGIQVVVEGSLAPGGVFRANNLMVKHANEYAPPEPGEEAPHRFSDLTEDRGGGS